MSQTFRVFLCSTFTDLVEERKSALEAIRQLQLQHDSMEFFGASTKRPIKTCLEEVRKSDILVVVVGHRYGNLVSGRGTSFSEAEYREGHRRKKPCLVYFRSENVRVLPKDFERDSRKNLLLEKWKSKLSKRHTISTFEDAKDLGVKIAADLGRTIRNLEEDSKPKTYVSSEDITQAVARTEQLRQAMTDLERAYDITLEALGDALDLKDTETEGHSKRVTAFTIALARAMGLSQDKIRMIARGAFLHDIGKMAIPDAILRKPGKLTEAETEIMREHCFRGYQMIKKIPFLSEAAEIVYAHQECFDGTGYPRGLRGNDIPLGARIFSVADKLDAITSDRPFRAAQTYQVARDEIERLSGKQFDPDVVRVFLDMPGTVWGDLRTAIHSQMNRFTYPTQPSSISSQQTATVQSFMRMAPQRFACPHCGKEIPLSNNTK